MMLASGTAVCSHKLHCSDKLMHRHAELVCTGSLSSHLVLRSRRCAVCYLWAEPVLQ